MKNKLAVSTNTYHGFSLEQALKGIAEAGYKYVELTAVKDYTEHVNWQMTEKQIEEIEKKLKDYDLKAIALSGHCNIMTDQGAELFLKNIELAARIGCQHIVTATGEVHGDKDEIEDESILIDKLKRLIAKCQDHEITLVLETHGNNYATGSILYELVKKIDSKYLGINYDTANVIFYGNIRPEEDMPKCIDKIYYIHLKDKLGQEKEWNFPAIGKGYIDFAKIFNLLKGQNYQGPISVEIEFTEDGPGCLSEVDQAVKDSYRYIVNNLL